MATPKNKHLIELMLEAGVKWPDGAEYAAQDKKDNRVHFYKDGKPLFCGGWLEWVEDYECTFIGDEHGVSLPSLCRNWHQTIVTKAQYEAAVAAGGDGKQEQQSRSGVAGVMPSESIEQLTADYYAKAAEADRLQAAADEALKASDDALLALEKAGELLGLVISVDTKPKQAEQQAEPAQPIITGWRDLRVGDVVEHIEDNGGDLRIGSIGKISEVDEEGIYVDYENWKGYGYGVPDDLHKFKFIRRP